VATAPASRPTLTLLACHPCKREEQKGFYWEVMVGASSCQESCFFRGKRTCERVQLVHARVYRG
jgi:hypothetical protein